MFSTAEDASFSAFHEADSNASTAGAAMVGRADASTRAATTGSPSFARNRSNV
jgi:hypothetical protein